MALCWLTLSAANRRQRRDAIVEPRDFVSIFAIGRIDGEQTDLDLTDGKDDNFRSARLEAGDWRRFDPVFWFCRHLRVTCWCWLNALCRAISMAIELPLLWATSPPTLEENNQYPKMKLALVSLFVGSAAAFSAVSFSL